MTVSLSKNWENYIPFVERNDTAGATNLLDIKTVPTGKKLALTDITVLNSHATDAGIFRLYDEAEATPAGAPTGTAIRLAISLEGLDTPASCWAQIHYETPIIFENSIACTMSAGTLAIGSAVVSGFI